MNNLFIKTWFFFILGSLIHTAYANPQTTSREYKVLLNPDNFSYSNEANNVNQYFSNAKNAIENKISRNVTGSLSFNGNRQVRFYDTQGSCTLNHLGYIFRERIENGKSEVTLKYRGYDPFIADFEDLSSSVSGAKTKFEDDITGKPGQPFALISSKSTTAKNTRNIQQFSDLQALFSGFANNYNYSATQSLNLVSGLNIIEREYTGAVIDLGEFDAAMELTLWYNGTPDTNSKPIAAEVSFKYEDANANYTKKVVNRAANTLVALNNMNNWTASGSTKTKTQLVYQYQSNFCN